MNGQKTKIGYEAYLKTLNLLKIKIDDPSPIVFTPVEKKNILKKNAFISGANLTLDMENCTDLFVNCFGRTFVKRPHLFRRSTGK